MPTDDTKLYHYTSGTGLIGIIKNDSIWATSIFSLNDTKEFHHAIELARAHIYSAQQLPANEKVRPTLEMLNEALNAILKLQIFVTSFSTKGDSLSQWRGYCPPGFGYNIAFDKNELSRIGSQQGFELKKCVYDPNDQNRMVQEWVENSISTIDGFGITEPGLLFGVAYAQVLSTFAFVAPLLKHKSFQDEDEWRLIGRAKDFSSVDFRPGKSMLIPYVPIKLEAKTNKSLIRGLSLGPTPNVETAFASLLTFAARYEVCEEIGRSAAPYREW